MHLDLPIVSLGLNHPKPQIVPMESKMQSIATIVSVSSQSLRVRRLQDQPFQQSEMPRTDQRATDQSSMHIIDYYLFRLTVIGLAKKDKTHASHHLLGMARSCRKSKAGWQQLWKHCSAPCELLSTEAHQMPRETTTEETIIHISSCHIKNDLGLPSYSALQWSCSAKAFSPQDRNLCRFRSCVMHNASALFVSRWITAFSVRSVCATKISETTTL